MPLLTSARLSLVERVEQRAATNAALAEVFENGLEDSFHYKTLRRPTLENHAAIRIKWRTFCDWYAENQRARTILPAEIEVGVELVSQGVIKEFVTFLAAGVKGILTDNAARVTIGNYVNVFFALWRRYANVPIPIPLRTQVRAYVDSVELSNVASLSTAIRAKPIADSLDLIEMVAFVIQDKTIFRTNCAKIQFNLINTIGATSGERPGGIIESSSYRGTNEAVVWRDLTVFISPNPDDPEHPWVSILLRIRNPKGHRGIAKYIKSFFFLLEPVGCRAQCPVTMFLTLALLRQIFRDVHTIEDILSPTAIPTKTHVLVIKDEFLDIPVFLAEVINSEGIFVMSESRALSADTHNSSLKRVSFAMGFILLMSMYCWRRGAANKFKRMLSDSDREAMMTHGPGSHMFKDAYESRVHGHDLGGIFHNRGQDQEKLKLTSALSGMSVGRDSAAPTQLSLQGRATLFNEPELMEMRETLKTMQEGVAALRTAFKGIDPATEDEEELDEFAALQGRIREERKQCLQFRAKYDAIINRETHARLKIERDAFFKNGSLRQLSGETTGSRSNPRPPLAEVQAAKFRTSRASGGANQKFLVTIEAIDPITRLTDILYNFAHDGNVTAETEAAVNAYLGLPERPFPPCYPGESPTEDNKCPVCMRKCAPSLFLSNETVGSHIHTCHKTAMQEHAQEEIEDEYEPRTCEWDGCKKNENGVVFRTRADFVEHVQTHFPSFSLPPSHNYPERYCRWSLDDGEMCLDTDEDGDLFKHFGQVHNVNLRDKVAVRYCVPCVEWTVDELGDGLYWEGHCHMHFADLFDRFSTRPDEEVDLAPIGIQVIDNTIEFQHGTGFSDAHPEFHGHCVRGVALEPGWCPWCVFDVTLSIELRMAQFLTPWAFQKHLHTHDELIVDDDKNLCPVPSCGTHRFSRFDLLTHMVSFHRVPICGATHHTVVRRLKLPPVPAALPEQAPVDLTHLHSDDDDNATTVTERTPTDIQAATSRRKTAPPAAAPKPVIGFCNSCSFRYHDIGKHLQASLKCYTLNQYEVYIGNNRSYASLKWPLTGPPPPAEGRVKSKRTHRCTSCRKLYADIREHKADPHDCKGPGPIYFTIKLSARKFTSKILISGWSPDGEAAPTSPDKGEGSSNGPRNKVVPTAPDKGEGSSKRQRTQSGSESEVEVTSKRGASKKSKAAVLQAPRSGHLVCEGCDERFTSLVELSNHLTTLRSNSKCADRKFRQRNTTSRVAGMGWGPSKPWDASMAEEEDESD
ncbi:hypothetical protein DFH06DRAFT_708967 [Mycena polygramma]|nr:hypothetical protein DFH06DRAFT_708967 [Mycena polygramma]